MDKEMQLISSTRSIFGSGQYVIHLWRDAEGNEYVGEPGAQVLTRPAAEVARLAARSRVVQAAGVAGRAGDWDEYERLVAEAAAM